MVNTPGDIVPQKEYEFDGNENEVIKGLSSAMKFVGIMSIVFGSLEILGGIFRGLNLQGVLTMGQGLILVVIGGWLYSGGGAFGDIVWTEGSDISLLMIGLRKLRSVYVLQAWLMVLACGFIALAIFMFVLGR